MQNDLTNGAPYIRNLLRSAEIKIVAHSYMYKLSE